MSEESGVSIPNLRTWEKRYNLFSPKRSSTNIRQYVQEDLSTLILIKYLIDSGYRIGKLSKYSYSELRMLVLTELKYVSSNYFEKQKLIDLLVGGKIDSFDEFLKICLEDVAPVEFVIRALEPVIRLLPVISNLMDNNLHFEKYVANKIMLRMLISSERVSSHSVENLEMLLLQSDSDYIPLNLSIVGFLASIKKYKANIILNSLKNYQLTTLSKELSPDIIYTEFNENQKMNEISDVLNALQKAFPLARIIASGSSLEKVWRTIPNKIYFTRSFEVLLKSL